MPAYTRQETLRKVIAVDKKNIKANQKKLSGHGEKKDPIALARITHRQMLTEPATGDRSTEVLNNGNVERFIGNHFEHCALANSESSVMPDTPLCSFLSAEEMDLLASPAELMNQMERTTPTELKRLIRERLKVQDGRAQGGWSFQVDKRNRPREEIIQFAMAEISRQRMAGDIDHPSGGGCPRNGGSSRRSGVDAPPGNGELSTNNGEYHEEQAEEDMFLDEGDLAEELEIDEAEQEAQLQRGFPETRAAVILARRKPSKKATLEPTAGRSKSGRAYQEISRQVAGFIVLFHV
mmetsp:Transcript_34468/g.63071  ORF Transcript_34468/g.63071 Transcript_34468/m.63071 type:complete len:294 (-) Transcript_34468:339-1220(-)